MSVEVWKATPPARPYRFELLPDDAMASALELLGQPLGERVPEELDSELAAAVERGLEGAMAFANCQSRERQAALVLLNSLLPLSPTERRRRIASHRPRFRSGELCRLFIDKTAEESHHNAAKSREFGELTVFAAEHIDAETPEAIRQDQLAEAWAAAAGGHRMGGDLAGATEALERAAEYLKGGSGTLMVRVTLLLEKAALECDREDFAAGLRFVDQALCILRAGTQGHGVARALAVKGRLELGAERPEAALPLFEEARRHLSESPDRALQLTVHQNLAFCLGELGRPGEARMTLRAAHSAAKLLGRPAARCRLLWLEGRLIERAGAPDAARNILRKAHRGWLECGHHDEAGLLGLELCRSDLEGRHFGRLARDLWLLIPIAKEGLAGSFGGSRLERRARYAVLDRSW